MALQAYILIWGPKPDKSKSIHIVQNLGPNFKVQSQKFCHYFGQCVQCTQYIKHGSSKFEVQSMKHFFAFGLDQCALSRRWASVMTAPSLISWRECQTSKNTFWTLLDIRLCIVNLSWSLHWFQAALCAVAPMYVAWYLEPKFNHSILQKMFFLSFY